ncbi:MAG TPA: glutaminyl-peptide cyclotransferase [Gemmatimonadota bacterium]|nr:glutaminyl-peptide cyclotransferase [Gemmatimonadota bacterium]
MRGTARLRLSNAAYSAAHLALFAWALIACEAPVERVSPEVVLTLPHDTSAYTQGLLFHNRLLWESTGGWGTSTIRQVDPQTGRVLRVRALPDHLFGEGLALVDSTLVQLTWMAGLAFVYDLDSLEVLRTFRYSGEGWGLCFDGASLYMSNGSDSLYRRDPRTFAVLEARPVTDEGVPVPLLNELECVGESVWANVYQEDRVVEIDKATGRVVRELDGYPLRLLNGVANDAGAVLNGIAYGPDADVFFLTGKLWPKMFVVRIPGPS